MRFMERRECRRGGSGRWDRLTFTYDQVKRSEAVQAAEEYTAQCLEVYSALKYSSRTRGEWIVRYPVDEYALELLWLDYKAASELSSALAVEEAILNAGVFQDWLVDEGYEVKLTIGHNYASVRVHITPRRTK